jgi:hypothetical protein
MSKWLLDLSPKSTDMSSSWYFAHKHTHKHTHTNSKAHNYTHPKNMQNHNKCVQILSDYRVHWLPKNTNQLYGHSTLRMVDVLAERHFSLNALLYTTQYKGSNHYVCVDVLPNCTGDWIHYYTHHTYKGAYQYVCADVLWDCSVDWMPFCTQHTYKGAHQYVCWCFTKLLWWLNALLHTLHV